MESSFSRTLALPDDCEEHGGVYAKAKTVN